MLKKCIRMGLVLLGITILAGGMAGGQKDKSKAKDTDKEQTAAAAAKTAAPGESAMDKFKALEFREIGPGVMGGRIDDFAAVESNPDIVYVGAAAGGVWKTTNNGTTWEPVFDKEGVSTIGDIAIAPSDPSVVWVG